MDLDARQTRGLFLAGTVPFPTSFPAIGPISLDVGHLSQSPGGAIDKDVVISQEFCGDTTVVRVILRDDVSAVFIAGVRDCRGVFRVSDRPQADSLEQGEWFFGADINVATVRARLNLQPTDDIVTRNSILRGIVFVPTGRPLLLITEVAQTAGAEFWPGCSQCEPEQPISGFNPPWNIPICSPCYFSTYHSLEVPHRPLDWNVVTGWACCPCYSCCPCPPCCPER